MARLTGVVLSEQIPQILVHLLSFEELGIQQGISAVEENPFIGRRLYYAAVVQLLQYLLESTIQSFGSSEIH